MPTEAEFVRDLLEVNSAACARYLAIASRSHNAVLRYVLGDIARQKRDSHQALQISARPDATLQLASTGWRSEVIHIYDTCEQEFDDDATDRLAARLLVAEKTLLEAVEEACEAATPGALSQLLNTRLPRFRAIPNELCALGRYNQHPA